MSKLVLITGASSGVGLAAARRFCREGWRTVLVARREAVLRELADELGELAIVAACDGADGDAVLAVAERIVADHGVPDAVVHCAGAGQWKEVEDTPPAELDFMMAAPFRSAFHFDHALVGHMIARGSGVLLHVNSPACMMPWPGATGYASARWALRGLAESLWQDLVGTGVVSSHVVLGEVSSSYFDANPDSHDKVPKVGLLIGVSTPEQCGDVLYGAAVRPRREVLYPFMLRVLTTFQRFFPGLTRYVVRASGRKR